MSGAPGETPRDRLIPEVHRVILVRHARSRVDPPRPPRVWGLTEDGRSAARRLAALALFDHATGYYAGPEPKMVQTLEPVAALRSRAVVQEAGFAESASEGWLGEAQFRETVRRFFARRAEAPAPGWEPADAVAARFGAAIARRLVEHAVVVTPGHALPGTFAVASGGRALMAYLSAELGPDALDAVVAFERWGALRMPDLAVLELAPGEATRVIVPFGTLTA
jgi:broad specificity phosphatase PhoE